jgi:hypothetical protein
VYRRASSPATTAVNLKSIVHGAPTDPAREQAGLIVPVPTTTATSTSAACAVAGADRMIGAAKATDVNSLRSADTGLLTRM